MISGEKYSSKLEMAPVKIYEIFENFTVTLFFSVEILYKIWLLNDVYGRRASYRFKA